MVAEVVRLLGYTENARILTNPATEILNGVWRRVDDASRALAAYLARRRFGYSAREVALALGYRGHGGVSSAVARIESAGPALRRTAEKIARKLR